MIAQTQGAALAPLSNDQKQKLAGLAALAYAQADSQVDFDEWRHSEVRRVVHRAGLRDCLNMHYLPLEAHFHELLGNTGRAFKSALKAETEPRTWALHALHREVTKGKDVMPEGMQYAKGFLRNKRSVSLDEASDRDIWHAVFTVRKKIQALRKVKRGGESAADVLARILPKTRPARERDPEKEPF